MASRTELRFESTPLSAPVRFGFPFTVFAPGSLPSRVERIQTENGSEFQAAFHWHAE